MIFRRASDESAVPTERGAYRRIVELWARYRAANPTRKFWAELVCPTCGRASMVGDNHDVLDDGTVSPSYVCPHSCTFHTMIKLADWDRK